MPIILERDFPDKLPEFFRAEEILERDICEYLIKIREALTLALPRFPEDTCVNSANYVKTRTNLSQVWGYFIDPTQSWNCITAHAWNQTEDGLWYVDLTIQQFNPNFPSIAIVSGHSLNLQPHSEIKEKILSNGFEYSPADEIARINHYLDRNIS